jgi:hypothetical protein
LGLFIAVTMGESSTQVQGYNITTIQLDAGDKYAIITTSLTIIKPENDNGITGIYQVYPTQGVEYAINNGLNLLHSWCSYQDYPVEEDSRYGVRFKQLNSGTITITRVNEAWKYKIDVDVIAVNGYEIKGSFNGEHMYFFDGYAPDD